MTDDLATKIAQLEALRPMFGDAWVDAKVAELRSVQPQSKGDTTRVGDVRDATGVAVGTGASANVTQGPINAGRNVQVANSIHNYGSANAPDKATLRRDYLRALAHQCNQLSLSDADSNDPTHREVELASVYTRLEVASVVQHNHNRDQRERQRTALEVASQYPRLVLLGEPGGGKSTFVNYLTLCLAQASLGKAQWLNDLGSEWKRGALVPIRAVLREFAAWLVVRPKRPPRGAVELFWLWLAQQHGMLLAQHLRELTSNGQALLLLDGLDEVPAEADGFPLDVVVETIQALAATAGDSPLLVTCRVLDYEQERRRQLPRWPTERIIPLSTESRQTFIIRWYATLERLGRRLKGDAQTLRAQLTAEVSGRPELSRLAGNPLLLTMMAQLHATEGELPGERVRLYARCIDFLLNRWRARPGEQPLRAALALPQWGESDLGRLLDRLGFVAHERGVGNDGEQGADLPSSVLIDTAQKFFAPFDRPGDPPRGYGRAEAFFHHINRHGNGVLQQYQTGVFRFPHRTFQEFLAARRLVEDGDWPPEAAEFVDRALARAKAGPQWREALLLAVSQLVIVGGQIRPAVDLVEELLRQGTHTPEAASLSILAGELLHEIGREKLLRLGQHRAELWQRTTNTLLALLTARNADDAMLLSVGERVRAGHALGRLGDTRPGVCTLEPDWCKVPAGVFLLGSDDADELASDDEKPQKRVALPAFRIARYPVTNAQWRLFMDDGGYDSQGWWSKAGWQAKQKENWSRPRYWDNLRFNGPNQPVVGISWYEATAYCRWLSSKLGYTVRLPSEAEWEKAARGSDGRVYPWGNAWDAARANTRIGATTPVGCYLAGASFCDALDMSGNVWEWTMTPWVDSYKQSDGTAIELSVGERFVFRGGSWALNPQFARCASRLYYPPADWLNSLGLRVCAPSQ
jgi:formylglycine-generating enzyme required for sulfatase activity